MTPEVHSILIEARQRIARRVLTVVHFQDTNALHIIDQLLLGATVQSNQEDAALAPSINTEAVEATPNCKASEAEAAENPQDGGDLVADLDAAQREIARLKKLREQDSKIIDGLRKRE